MKLTINTVIKTALVTVAAVGMFFVPDAQACGVRQRFGLAMPGFLGPAQGAQPQSTFADMMPGLRGGDVRDDRDSEQRRGSIVGMWTVNFYLDPAESLWDVAIEQFSVDGNEMTNDIAVPPNVGNICWGVWEQVGNRVYKMKHIGWTFDENGVYSGRFDFEATLVVDKDGDTITGKFVADQEDLSGNFIPALHAEGPLKGTRFKIN